MPTPEEMRAAIEAYIQMMCDNDVDGILDLYSEDGTAEDPVGGTIQSGQEELRNFYAGTVSSLQVEITGPIRVAGKEAAVPMLAELTMNDNKLYLDVIDVMTFDDAGKITGMRAFWNPAEMRPTR
ncbi:MAG: nuclear transport factor 2 family protein [Deltaproteobacteria bacterium]|nr:nuclear transport factor 2 family protein [Deltaproteobacteria bacterium]MBW2445506.1 nuclear transport factor 2 family protein [Deltaproteobacteria bacterium]